MGDLCKAFCPLLGPPNSTKTKIDKGNLESTGEPTASQGSSDDTHGPVWPLHGVHLRLQGSL